MRDETQSLLRAEDFAEEVEHLFDPENDEDADESERIGLTFGELVKLDIPPREEIILGLGRREVGTLNAVTNVGKTTLLRNLAISLCVGRSFPPFGQFTLPKRIAFLDFEDTRAFMRSDYLRMLNGFSDQERDRFNSNALLLCEDTDIEGEDLRLSNYIHLALVTRRLQAFSPDLIVVDTISSAFSIRNENDNAEVRDFILRPLRQLAKDTNAVVLATHHIGKSKSEDGQTKEAVFRGRGASSFADMARTVFNLECDPIEDCVIWSCPKLKSTVRPTNLKLKLNPETRWFESQGESKLVSNYDLMLEMFSDGEVHTTAEVIEEFKGLISERTLKRILNEAVNRGDLCKMKQGVYQRPSTESISK